MTYEYLFLLGNTPALSFAEIRAVFPDAVFSHEYESILKVTLSRALKPEVIDTLGGTVKIFEHLKTYAEQPESLITELYDAIIADLGALRTNKITLAVAEIGRDHLPPIELAALKNELIASSIKTRYIEGSRHGLSSAILSHKKVSEYAIIQTAQGSYLAKTFAVQDIDSWTFKDRGKPYANRKKGMLPPKLARIMVNLATGGTPTPGAVLYDPFCGTGTILIEALEAGINVVGSDTDSESAAGARQNVQWFIAERGLTRNASVFQADVSRAMLPIREKITYLVTEPFLGRQTPQPDQLPGIFKGLEKMYLGAFRHWRELLAPGARIVCIFPCVQREHTEGYPDAHLHRLIDKLQEIGYTTTSETVVYHRPQAVISREIYQFTYTTEK